MIVILILVIIQEGVIGWFSIIDAIHPSTPPLNGQPGVNTHMGKGRKQKTQLEENQ